MINNIKDKFSISNVLTQQNINMYRFSFQHIIDKLKYRLYQDELFSQYFLTSSMDWFLECYTSIAKLERGKPKLLFKYIKQYEPSLYKCMNEFYTTQELQAKYDLLIKTAKYMLKDLGGLWQENEVLFHLNKESATDKEKDLIANLLGLNEFN